MTRNIFVQEEFVNATKGYRFGESDPQESRFTRKGDLYRFCVKEYGRCVSKVYIDTPAGVKAIGWVFIKREQYTDCNDTYLQEAWITMHKAPPQRSIKYNYL
jgi:hypothetical protein